MAPQTEDAGAKGRRFDYTTGRNLAYTPRGDVTVSFADLRALSFNCELMRTIIEARHDQMAAMDWAIRPRTTGLAAPQDPIGDGVAKLVGEGPADASTGEPIASRNANPTTTRKELNAFRLPRDVARRIQQVTDFFTYPDKENTWDQWMRAVNEDLLVIDAPTVWQRRQRNGDLYALELIDGSTIFPLADASGRRPTGDGEPAYQQILKGIVAADFTAAELLYMPRNVKTNRFYGFSPVEQVVMTANTAIRRSIFQLEYYLSGSTPDAFVGLPAGWNLQNIKDFQNWFDGLLEGNLSNRRKTRFMPGEFKYVETKEPPLKDDYDEWLARVISFAFQVSAQPFITRTNRGSDDEAQRNALEQSKLPQMRWWKQFMDRLIRFGLKMPDLEFVFLDDREQDPKAQMEIDTGYVKAGVLSIDEVRTDRGRIPLGGVAETPMLATTSGYVPLGALTGANAVAALASQGSPAANAVNGTKTGDSGGVRQVANQE
jgi:hypothetical protein